MSIPSRIQTILTGIITHNKIANGYLFCTPSVALREMVARYFCKGIKCEQFTQEPCQKCPSCTRFESGSDVDFIYIGGESPIKVEQIRNLLPQIQYGPSQSKALIVLIQNAHLMSDQASNALLKTLESPPANVHFILLSQSPFDVLSTIRSRCQYYVIPNTLISHTLPDPYYPLSDILASSLGDRMIKMESICKDKSLAVDHITSWINDFSAQNTQENAISQINLLLETVSLLRQNVNCRHQMDALMLQL